jgi:serine/arginine repetitive matrix protein 2
MWIMWYVLAFYDQRLNTQLLRSYEQEREGDEVFTVTALSDDHAMDQPSAQSSALMHEVSKRMSPTPRIPGYIPGMQRPMTPHDIPDPEEQMSATPRATSPRFPLNGSYNGATNTTNSSLSRRDSNASTAKQPSRTGTPLSVGPGGFLSRSLNGRYTPTEERQGPDPFDSDRNLSKRRPASPLSNAPFRPMVVPPNESPSTSSRPNTPSSNAILQPQHPQHQSTNSTSSSRPTHVRHGSGHSRNGSISSLSEVLHNPNFNSHPTSTSTRPDVNKTITRNARSPALPDSPYIESGRTSTQGYSPGDKERTGDHERAPSVISGMDPGSPFSFSRMLRSPTPNGNVPPTTTTAGMTSHQESVGKRAKSPSFSIDQPSITSTSTTTTKMGGHQKHESGSSFVLSLGPSTQPLVLTPFLNSSRSSFGSEGSSYHSIDEENGKKDRVKVLFAKIEGELPEWHDFRDGGIDTARVPGGPEEVSFRSLVKEEEVVKQLSGLSRDDFVAVQERLLDTVQLKVDRGERDKAGSVMKKRRPSTSQSFYPNGATTNGRVSTLHTFLSLASGLTESAPRRSEALHRRTRGPRLLLRRTRYRLFRLLVPRSPWRQKRNPFRIRLRPRRRAPF